MSIDSEKIDQIKTKLGEVWGIVLCYFTNNSLRVKISEKNPTNIFVYDGTVTDQIKFDIKPIILSVPERSQLNFDKNNEDNDNITINKCKPDILVVINGWLSFEFCDDCQEFQTFNYSTRVEMYRENDNELTNIYGAHYDHAIGEFGHPRCHAQFSGSTMLSKHIKDRFKNYEIPDKNLNDLIRSVRLPSPQLDFFSVILQLYADHMLSEETKNNFEEIQKQCDFFRGINYNFGALDPSRPTVCMRSIHWY